MDSFRHLRTHSRVVQKGGRPLVSVGYAFRYRKFREEQDRRAAAARERDREWRRRYDSDPNNLALTALGRGQRLAALNGACPSPAQTPEAAVPRDRSAPPVSS